MAHHKRGRPKSSRAGCLFCKPFKATKAKRSRHGRAAQRRPQVNWRDARVEA